VYEKTDGRLGARLGGIDMLLLTTRGRRSGLPRTQPLACYRDGEDLIVVASNNGLERHPAWWLNLQAHPDAEVRFGRESRRVRAVTAGPEERARLWPWLEKQNPFYGRYAQRTTREIPVVILRRRED
jgi:deazaflavin-dependent oxidoreductase (nitroreductase family)